MNSKIIFIFLDGVGLGAPVMTNPFFRYNMPWMESILKGKFIASTNVYSDNLLLKGIDACLGVPGVPQSATGQTALFTGINAAKHLGYHYPAFPDKTLQKVIAKDSIFKKVTEKGLKATFANAYTDEYFQLEKEGKRHHSVTTLSVMAAGLPFRNMDDLRSGNAVYWDITNTFLRDLSQVDIPLVDPLNAGKNLVALAENHEFVVFECFMPDGLGHKRKYAETDTFLKILDKFLQGVCEYSPEDVSVVITSDHGNLEDFTTGGHTYNPVPLLVWGKVAALFNKLNSIAQLSRAILDLL